MYHTAFRAQRTLTRRARARPDPPFSDAVVYARKMKGNNQLPNAHFKKDWQGNAGPCRVRTWLNQGTSGRSSDGACDLGLQR